MIKWANYLISEVRYNKSATTKEISDVKVQKDKGDRLGLATVWTRQDIFEAINLNMTFFTIIKINENEWKKGSAIQKFNFLNTWYLKTKVSLSPGDDIDDLPEF